jgi:hypothetical protein
VTKLRLAVFACRRTAHDLPGAVALPCAGRIAAGTLIEAVAAGAAGVAVAPCGAQEHGCRFENGATRAERAAVTAGRVLGRLGLAAERVAILRSRDDLDAFRSATARLGPTGIRAGRPPDGAAGVDRWMAVVSALSADPALTPRRGDGRRDVVGLAGRAETVLWEGCTPWAELLLEEALGGARSGDGLLALAGAGIRAQVLADERCCGAPLLALGRRDEFQALASLNARRLRESGTRRVIARCRACAEILSHEYPAAGAPLGAEVTTLVEALAETGARLDPAAAVRLTGCSAAEDEAAARLLPKTKPIPGGPLHEPGRWLGGAAQRRAVDGVLGRATRKRVATIVASCPRCALALRLLGRAGSWRPGAVGVLGPGDTGTGRTEGER